MDLNLARVETLNSSSQIETLELLQIVTDRFSHSLRTHLGVAAGVVDDLIDGFTLEAEDLKDAQSSLKSIVDNLNSVRELSNNPKFEPKSLALDDFFAQHGSGALTKQLAFRLVLALEPTNLRIEADEQMLLRAFAAIFSYVSHHCSPENTQLETEVILSTARCQDRSILAISFPIRNDALMERLSSESSWRDVAKIDHCTSSLGLLFADAVFSLHKATLSVTVSNNLMTLRAKWQS